MLYEALGPIRTAARHDENLVDHEASRQALARKGLKQRRKP